MIKYDKLKLSIQKDITFESIPSDQYQVVMNDLENKLTNKMINNQMKENESIQKAKELGTFGVNKGERIISLKKRL